MFASANSVVLGCSGFVGFGGAAVASTRLVLTFMEEV
jgi:hypothetical protein